MRGAAVTNASNALLKPLEAHLFLSVLRWVLFVYPSETSPVRWLDRFAGLVLPGRAENKAGCEGGRRRAVSEVLGRPLSETDCAAPDACLPGARR